jgi:hypothetical protein
MSEAYTTPPPRSPTERRTHVLDEYGSQYLFSDLAASTPPLHVDHCWNGRQVTPLDDGPKRFSRTTFAPFEGDQHPSIERKRHAARLRDFFLARRPAVRT